MKDIFEILQHENHELELIHHKDEYMLGCKTCGKTLLTESYVKVNVDEYESILKTLAIENNKSELYNLIKRLGICMLKINERAFDYIVREVLTELRNRMAAPHLSEHAKVSKEFNIKNLIMEVYSKVYEIKNARKLMAACYDEDPSIGYYMAVRSKVLEALEEKTSEYTFYDDKSVKAIGCKAYKIEGFSDAKCRFFSIHNELAKQLEEKYPTPTEKYTFKDVYDFYDKQPDWDNEENEDPEYHEYMYRIENDLYDFNNIEEGKDVIIKNAISVFEDYDCTYRFTMPLKKILKDIYNINI